MFIDPGFQLLEYLLGGVQEFLLRGQQAANVGGKAAKPV
jgi:hypothetical protein